MTSNYFITISGERKHVQHLGAEERGAIQALEELGYSNRAVAHEINCSHSTVGYELKRGAPEYSGRCCKPGYSAKRGAALYRQNGSRCRNPNTTARDSAFIKWMVNQV